MLNIEKSEKELPKVEFPTLTISAINKHGIPTKQIENTILFIDENSIIINNKEENNNYDKQELIELINKNISMLEKIKLEQTPEFIHNHTLIDNTSKQFCLKYMNYYFNLSYHTGTFSDKLIEEFINQIINIVLNHKKSRH